MATIKDFRNSVLYYVKYLIKSADENHILLLASGLSFSVLTCILPFILILFSILGNMLSQPEIEQEIALYVERIIPYDDEAKFVKNVIAERAESFKVYGSAAGYVGIIAMVVMASGLFGSMRTILNRIYKAARTRSVWTGKLTDIGLLFLVMFYFLISVAILPTSEALLETAKRVEILSFLRTDTITNFMLATVTFIIAFVSFYIVYLLLPQKKLRQKVVLVSAIVAAIFWQIANQLFGIYISHAITLKSIYGTYSLVIVVAIWIYYTSVVFIVGAVAGQAYKERHNVNI